MRSKSAIEANNIQDRPRVFIRHRFLHMGAHSGYDMLVPSLEQTAIQTNSIFLEFGEYSKYTNRILGAITRRLYTTKFYSQNNLVSELRALTWKPFTGKIIHILYGEDNLGILARVRGHPNNRIVVTIHQPMSWWEENGLNLKKLLGPVDALIVLSSTEAKHFSEALNKPVHFVPHGVDVNFFSPVESEKSRQIEPKQDILHCVFVGNWLRDFSTLYAVLIKLNNSNIRVHFDIVTPENARRSLEDQISLNKIVELKNVTLHRNVSDDDLRKLYRQSALLLLPLIESTANNAILEAMACGVPIVTNETAGIGDYTSAAYAVVTLRSRADMMADAALHILTNIQIRKNMSEAARQTAVNTYSWDRIAAKVSQIYDSL